MHSSRSRWHSFQNAFRGIRYLIQTQRNTWIYIPVTVLVIFFGFYFRINTSEWVATTISLGLVWSLECINTAIETTVDLVSPEFHPLAKIAKDCAAGGVLLSAVAAGIIGLIVFLPRVIQLFSAR